MVKYTKEHLEKVMSMLDVSEEKAKNIFDTTAKDLESDGIPTSADDVLYVIELDQKALKNNVKLYAQSEKPKKAQKKSTKKVDEEKKKIIEILQKALTDSGYNAIITNVDKTIDFENYTVNLVKHRPPKK